MIRITLNSDQARDRAIQILQTIPLSGENVLEISDPKGTITDEQFHAVHLYCELVAQALNDGGFSFNDGKVIQTEVEFTKERCYEQIWKVLQIALFPKKKHLKQLNKMDVDKIYDYMNKALAERAGVHVPFPSKEQL